MVFSSPLFLFAFLPAVIGLYFLTPRPAKNSLLLGASLLFYLVGSGAYVLILIGSIVWNYALALAIDRADGRRRKEWLALAIAGNLAPLLIYKYGAFGVTVINQVLAWKAWAPFALPHLFLPAGISFFTFQGISYLIDIFRRELPPCRSLRDYALYKSFFPQLIAGPIVRYRDLARELQNRASSLAGVEAGLVRFGFGLGKKILLADNLGRVADSVFGLHGGDLTTATAWLGILCYTFQIFSDFSGYSDMAIGLGRVFGLTLPENFRQPYRSASVTEFWRRWHITLSTWFRDYFYFPLGGNRLGMFRTGFNLVLVFFLCGLWHGAAWTFVGWGLYQGVLLLAERVLRIRWGIEPSGLPGRALPFLLVLIGWVFFRSHSFSEALDFLRTMFGHSSAPSPLFSAAHYLTGNNVCYLLLAALCAFWPEHKARDGAAPSLLAAFRPYAALVVTALAMIAQSPQSFNPFIYFQF